MVGKRLGKEAVGELPEADAVHLQIRGLLVAEVILALQQQAIEHRHQINDLGSLPGFSQTQYPHSASKLLSPVTRFSSPIANPEPQTTPHNPRACSNFSLHHPGPKTQMFFWFKSLLRSVEVPLTCICSRNHESIKHKPWTLLQIAKSES
jgi:hypothetical protein